MIHCSVVDLDPQGSEPVNENPELDVSDPELEYKLNKIILKKGVIL
jgi:hypothetical protein